MTTEQRTKTPAYKIIIAVIVFLILAGLVFAYLNKVFSIGDNDSNRQTFKAFYAEEDNTIDVAYLGTSASNRYFINPKAFHDEGISSFTMATMGMPLFFVPNLIEEFEKTQDPDLYIIELRWVYKDREMLTDAHIRRVTDNMKLSENKLDAIDTAMEFMGGSTGAIGDITYDKINYLVPIIKYHSKLAQNDTVPGDWKITCSKNETKGYVMSYSTLKQVNQFPSRLSEKRTALSEEAEKALNDVLDYCDKLPEDKQVLFVLSPFSVKKDQMPRFNTAIDIVRDRGYDVINFNTEEMYDEVGIDWDKDFYNSKHLNYKGAEKYTNWLTAYLKENYNLEDHRGDEKYDSWEDAYDVYRDYVKCGILTVGYRAKLGEPEVIVKQNNPDAEKLQKNKDKQLEELEEIKEKNGIEDEDEQK